MAQSLTNEVSPIPSEEAASAQAKSSSALEDSGVRKSTADSEKPEQAVEVRVPSERPSDAPPRSLRAGAAPKPDDLIVELFEDTHELFFRPDMVSGIEYAVELCSKATGAGIVVIHVLDLNTSELKVVRALGRSASEHLLETTSAKDAWFQSILRKDEVTRVGDYEKESTLDPTRLVQLGADGGPALFAPLFSEGRCLGLIECAAPDDGVFNSAEVHALDYLRGQLGAFLAQRPIVLEEDFVTSSPRARIRDSRS